MKYATLVQRAIQKTDWKELRMKGWKTWLAAVLIGASGAAKYLGQDAIAETVLYLAGAFGLIGIGHKVDKLKQ